MLVNQLRKRLSNQFVRNAGWLGIAEIFNRFFRLGTTIVLARVFSTYDYGLIAIIYTVHGFAEVFTSKIGLGAKIVQTEKQHLEAICNTAYWVSWIVCGSMFLLQCAVAFPVAHFYQDSQLILPICVLGLKYLIIPFFKVQSSLLKRNNQLKVHAIANVLESLISNGITIILVLMGMGIWAIVCSMILSTAAKGGLYAISYPWNFPKQIRLEKLRDVMGFGGGILGVSLLERLRTNLDYLLVGNFLGVEALGLYFFAFNAGIGISQNVINSFISSLFPHLCEVQTDIDKLKKRYSSGIKAIAIVVIPLVLLQSSLAPAYVPIVFGEKWVNAVPLLSIICLSAIPMAVALTSYQLLNAVNRVKVTLIWNGVYTVVFAIVIAISAQWGVLWVACAVLICQASTLFFSLWATNYVFRQLRRAA